MRLQITLLICAGLVAFCHAAQVPATQDDYLDGTLPPERSAELVDDTQLINNRPNATYRIIHHYRAKYAPRQDDVPDTPEPKPKGGSSAPLFISLIIVVILLLCCLLYYVICGQRELTEEPPLNTIKTAMKKSPAPEAAANAAAAAAAAAEPSGSKTVRSNMLESTPPTQSPTQSPSAKSVSKKTVNSKTVNLKAFKSTRSPASPKATKSVRAGEPAAEQAPAEQAQGKFMPVPKRGKWLPGGGKYVVHTHPANVICPDPDGHFALDPDAAQKQ